MTNHIVRKPLNTARSVSCDMHLLSCYISDYRGNRILVGLSSANIVLFCLAKLYYVKVNQRKDSKWNFLSDIEKSEYLAVTRDTGMKKRNVRFVH